MASNRSALLLLLAIAIGGAEVWAQRLGIRQDLRREGSSPASGGAEAQQPALRQVGAIPLPGVEGRIDHMAADAAHQRLFVAALGNNTVEVIGLHEGRRLHTISGLHEPQGTGYAPGLNRLFVANGQSGTCTIFDAGDYRVVDTLALEDDADNVRWDAKADRVWIGCGSGALDLIDAAGRKRLGRVSLSAHPESFQLETNGPRIYVNVPSAGHIAVVDRNRMQVTATWPLIAARSNFPMALDEAGHRLFVGCRDPARVLVYDTRSGKETASMDITGDTDDLFYDAGRRRLYVSCGAGFIDVIQQADAGKYVRESHIATAPGARTSLYVPELNRLYLAVPHRGSQRA
ncbi:MAG TPA: YncE family protein, partial [Chthonomonadaceae bacterium]|nr:YncE family protein [Chthonomonadaceae bacterium]